MQIVRKLLLVAGVALLFFPIVSSLYQRNKQQSLISTYETKTETADETEREAELQKAREYNSLLYQTQSTGISLETQELLVGEHYENLLNLTGTGMMGSITIPKINVELPIYHGTGENVLAQAIGHVENTSLPVGGESTRSVLSGHRGLPTAKLFTRLDELKVGDLFLLNVCGEKLAYRVNEIVTILPEEVDALEIEAEKDLVSLVTCTPYGINSHRLVVTGECIDYTEAKEIEADIEPSFSWREIVFTVLPFAVVIMITGQSVWEYRKKKKGEKVHEKKD